ncbi:MAG: hypothetical protein ABI120_14530, partial [Gemmatimonadaceae bacterium]
EWVAPVSATLTVTNGGSDVISALNQFISANGTSIVFGLPGNSATVTLYGVPSSSLIAGDLHQVSVLATDATATATRGAFSWFKDLANKSVALGPVLSVPTVTSAFATVLRPRTQGTFQPEYQTGIGVSYAQSGTNRTVTVSASKGYFGNAATTFDLDTPDLTSASGFQAMWGLSQGFATAYSITATNATSNVSVDGSQYLIAGRSGSVPPAAIRASTSRR